MPRGAYQMIIEGPALQTREDGKRKLKIEPTLTQALLTDIETGGGNHVVDRAPGAGLQDHRGLPP